MSHQVTGKERDKLNFPVLIKEIYLQSNFFLRAFPYCHISFLVEIISKYYEIFIVILLGCMKEN